MVSILNNILTIISSLITFIIHAIESLLNLLIKIPTYITFITESINLLPAMIVPFAIAAVSIYYVLFTLNR